jgi:hypothetical protein
MADTPTGEFAFQAMEDLSSTFVARMPTFPHSEDIEEWAYHATVHFFFCKSFKTYQAMRILCRLGFLEDANVLARTIFEQSLCSDLKGLLKTLSTLSNSAGKSNITLGRAKAKRS